MNIIDSMPSHSNEIHTNGMDKCNLSTMQLEEDNNDFDNLQIEIDSDADRASLETSFTSTKYDDYSKTWDSVSLYMNKCKRSTM